MGFLQAKDKCGMCGRKGALDFGGVLRCDSCINGNQEKHEQKEHQAGMPRVQAKKPLQNVHLNHHRLAEVSIDELEQQVARALESTSARHVSLQDCKSCGAQVEIPKELAIGECLFCGRKVKSGEPEPSTSSPDQGLIPFTVTEEQAVDAMKAHLKKLWLRPGGLASQITQDKIRKVFVPFWVFDTNASTEWTGQAQIWQEAGWLAKKFGRRGSYKKVPLSGSRANFYNDWLVCASHGVGREVLRQIEPFHTEGLLKAADRQGFVETPLEMSSLGPRQAWTQAQTDMRREEFKQSMLDAVMQGRVGEDDVTINGRVQFSEPKGKGVVLPLYIFTGGAGGKTQIVVNGETGSVGSSIAYSWFKTVPLGLLGAFAALVICILSGGLAVPASMIYMAYLWLKGRRQRKRDEASFVSN